MPFADVFARTPAGDTVIGLDPGRRVTLAPIVVRRLTQIAVPGIVRDVGGDPVPGVEISVSLLDALPHRPACRAILAR